MECPHCDNGSGWILDKKYGYVCCAECNDDVLEPKPRKATTIKLGRIVQGYVEQHSGWLRLFGYGVGWKDHRVHRPLFSERYGHTKHLHIKHYCFTWLKRFS